MSMTREEAIALFEKQLTAAQVVLDSGFGSNPGENNFLYRRRKEMAEIALTALRPISREQVEEVWKPCKVCNGKTTLYQHTNTTKLFMNTFGKATTLVTECNGCPPYADCCMKGISMNSAFRISYCPECGRPLTDEAVETIMKRMEEMRND